MNAKFIIDSIAKSYEWGSRTDFAMNIFLKDFESDFINITKAGYIHECEVKVSRSDFKADFDKTIKRWNRPERSYDKIHKHDSIKYGEYGLKTFTFVCPKNLLKIEDMPFYCGLWEVDESRNINILKKSPVLLNAKKISRLERQKLNNFYKYRWRDFYFKGVKENG